MSFLLADILQVLVLILFDVVGSMKEKRKTRKQNETCGIFENQDMSQWVVFLKRNNCIWVYIFTENSSNPWHLMAFSLQERESGPRLHSGTSLSGRFHMKTLTSHEDSYFPRYHGIYSIYDKSNPLLNEIKPMINALWPITAWGKNLQQTECKRKLIQFNVVLSEGNNRLFRENNQLFFCDSNLSISQIQNWQVKMIQKDRLHIHIT